MEMQDPARFGPCDRQPCTDWPIYRVGSEKVCEAHKGKHIAFAPFLGQQEKFFWSMVRVLFYGGAGAGGKSTCGMAKFAQQLAVEAARAKEAEKHGRKHRSHAWGIYFRRVSNDLQQAIERSREIFEVIDPKAKLDLNTGTWTFPSCGGAKFQFAHMQHANDRFKYKSREFTYIFFDELTEFEQIQYEYLETRLRTDDPFLEPFLQICSASNPDGEGLIWVREKFIEVAEPEEIICIETELGDGRIVDYQQVFIPAKLSDNPKLMASGKYEASLLNQRPDVREAILEGNWWLTPGAFLGRVWQSDMHVCEVHDIPESAVIFRTGDWGINKPSSLGWWYLDSEGGLTMFDHLRTVGLTVDKVCRKAADIERKYDLWDEDAQQSRLNLARNPLDSACFKVEGHTGAPTIAKDFRKGGFRWKPANKGPGSRYNGANEILKRMQTFIPAAFEGATHPTERLRPMLRMMANCESPIRTLPTLRADPNNIDDVDTDGDDHDWDMTMYCCLERPLPNQDKEAEDEDAAEDALFAPRAARAGGQGDAPWTR